MDILYPHPCKALCKGLGMAGLLYSRLLSYPLRESGWVAPGKLSCANNKDPREQV